MGEATSIQQSRRRRHVKHLGITHPALVKEIHPLRNEGVLIEHLSYGSDRRIWWLGICGHEWQAAISHRVKGKGGCPTCRKLNIPRAESLGFLYPYLISEWSKELNAPLTPFQIKAGSQQRVWWTCSVCDFTWSTRVYSRTYSLTGCPDCARREQQLKLEKYRCQTKINPLAVTHPQLAELWATQENYPLTLFHVTENSHRKVLWKCITCDALHLEKVVLLAKATRRHQCPSCLKKRVPRTSSIH